MKYINFYKRALQRGCLHGLLADDDLNLRPANPARPAAYITRMFDTGDEDTTFNRIAVDGHFDGARLDVVVAVSDSAFAMIDGEERDLSLWLADEAIPAEQKLDVFCAMRHVRAIDCADLLLHELVGRYVWVYVSAHPAGECSWYLHGLRLEFPRESFTDYLPEIYRQNEFYDRFIAVFQSRYLDLERRVDGLPRLLDYEAVDNGGAQELAGWLGLEDDGLFTPEQLREYISHLDFYQGKKGTRAALEAVIELFCGARPRVVERFQWEPLATSRDQRTMLGRLYGEETGSFCVLLPLAPETVDSGKLQRLIGRYSPIGAPHRLVFLTPCSRADGHCYLDGTGILATPGSAEANSGSLDGFVALG